MLHAQYITKPAAKCASIKVKITGIHAKTAACVLSAGVGLSLNWTYIVIPMISGQTPMLRKSGTGQLKCLNAWFYYGDTVYTTIKDIIDCVKRGWQTGNSDTALDTYKEAKILIIDEIGLQYGTDSERIELYELFNYRYCEELPTIAVSNFTKDEVIQILGLRISDRLFSHALEFTIEGESKR